MALETKPFRNLPQLPNGTSVADNIKLTDCLPFQHTDINEGVNSFNKITMGQILCQPFASAGAISGDTYSATCSNFPDFAISYQDQQSNTHYYIGMKVRVVFNNGITYGSVSGGTYPKLNINNSGAIPLLAQGKTMASGACSTGQSLEFTLIPYGNGVAWDADSNVRESTSDYTIYTDGTKINLQKIVEYTNIPTTNVYNTKIFRSGNICYFSLYGEGLPTTVPEDCKPHDSLYCFGYLRVFEGTHAGSNFFATISKAGNIYSYNLTLANDDKVIGTCMWVCETT